MGVVIILILLPHDEKDLEGQMTKVLAQFKYGRKGFTIVEMLMVIAILGLIAAVAIRF